VTRVAGGRGSATVTWDSGVVQAGVRIGIIFLFCGVLERDSTYHRRAGYGIRMDAYSERAHS